MLLSINQKAVLTLLADAQCHSGTEIADKIGISQSAIFNQLKKLSELGLVYTTVTDRGYQLATTLQLLSQSAIEKKLTEEARHLIAELEIHDVLDSTNRYLMDKAQKTKKNSVVCFAEYQSAGKGRGGREWISPFGSNIYLSILWRFQQGVRAINGLSLAVGVAVVRTLKDCGIKGIGLKWPNDIICDKKKLAGILIEASGESDGSCHTIIGLGLNFYLPKQQAQHITQEWVDLNSIISGDASPLRNQFCSMLLNQLMPLIANFERDAFKHYVDEWREYDTMQGDEAVIYQGKKKYNGIIKGIDDDGLLLLMKEQGGLITFASGEVSFRQT